MLGFDMPLKPLIAAAVTKLRRRSNDAGRRGKILP
jgi:hypothetical protein